LEGFSPLDQNNFEQYMFVWGQKECIETQLGNVVWRYELILQILLNILHNIVTKSY
jgi:hypothetical protein